MGLERKVCGTNNPLDLASREELLVIVSGDQQSNKIVDELMQYAIPGMRRKFEGLQTDICYSDQKPFVIATWSESDASSFEKRWLWNMAVKHIKASFNFKILNIYLLDQHQEELNVVFGEDFYTITGQKFSDDGDKTVVRIFSQSEDNKIHDHRFRYQLGYRDWVNEEPDVLTSIEIGKRLQNFAKENSCDFKKMEIADLKEENMNLLLAVGQASEKSPSRCFIVSSNYKKGDQPLMLVGKGITFDTGGINVKPFESFVNCMKNDMGGAALMANLFMGLVAAGYDKPLVLVIPCCENLVAQKSMKPGAVVKARNGKKVFIEHTDAEGRLILADAISYGQENFDPHLTLVAATLTTAALRQFSGFFTAVHFAPDNVKDGLEYQSKKWGENFSFWDEFIPYKLANKTKAADLTNMGRLPGNASGGGGSNIAAHFLKEFAKKPMVHFDIFASTWNWSGDYPGAAYGSTGAPFNAIFEMIRKVF